MMKLGKWSSTKFDGGDIPSIAGISGGETSGMMAALLDWRTVLAFENTGRESNRTYEYLGELADGLQREIVWMEYRPPRKKGDRPCKSRFQVVSPDRADRTGAPFEMLMEALNAFRAAKGKGPIAPWWKSRICTTYMKTRTARNYVIARGWTTWNEFVGLRADEPDRVRKLRVGVPKRIGRYAPLFDAGITKEDVREFWDAQSFKLGLDPIMGNCTGCFLKDQADLSRALAQPETDAEWWAKQESRWPGWGGQNFAGYRRLASEAEPRLAIERALRAGETPVSDGGIPDARRFHLVVIQEKKRLARQVMPFSCGCEGSQAMAELDPDEEDDFILGLPSEDVGPPEEAEPAPPSSGEIDFYGYDDEAEAS